MPIFKTKKNKGFTVIDNKIINGPLSSNARMMLILLLSKPKDWVVVKHVIKKELGLGEHVFRKVYKELRDEGYIEESTERTRKGRFAHAVINVYDNPKSIETGAVNKPLVDDLPADKQLLLNTDNKLNKKTTNKDKNDCLLQPESKIGEFSGFEVLKEFDDAKINVLKCAAESLDKTVLQQIINEFKMQRIAIHSPHKWLLKMIHNAKEGCFMASDELSRVSDDGLRLDAEKLRESNARIVSLSKDIANQKVLKQISSIKSVQPGRAIDLMKSK
jgi:hypothetical protein